MIIATTFPMIVIMPAIISLYTIYNCWKEGFAAKMLIRWGGTCLPSVFNIAFIIAEQVKRDFAR